MNSLNPKYRRKPKKKKPTILEVVQTIFTVLAGIASVVGLIHNW